MVFDLKNDNFTTGSAKINLKKNTLIDQKMIRIYISSNHQNQITTINKAVFTSCKLTDKCPPWQLEASKIQHDKNKKRLI